MAYLKNYKKNEINKIKENKIFKPTGTYEISVSKPDSAFEIVLTYDIVDHMDRSTRNELRRIKMNNHKKHLVNKLLNTLKVIGLI